MSAIELDFKEPEVAEVKQDRLLGVYENMADHEYRYAPGINKSGMDNFMRSPLHYLTIKKDPPPPTPQMFVGSAFHALVLEPERFAVEYIQDQYRGSQSKEAIAWRLNMREEGKTVINTKGGNSIWAPSDWDMIHHMRDAVAAHPIASVLLQGKSELSIFWIDKKNGYHKGTGKLCKARIDVHNEEHNVILDLKSAADASYEGFRKAVNNYHYNIQAAFYSDGWEACGKTAQAFIFVVVEKEPPYGVGCYVLDRAWLVDGRTTYQHTLMQFKDCMEANEWPCYPTEVRDLAMPAYAKRHAMS